MRLAAANSTGFCSTSLFPAGPRALERVFVFFWLELSDALRSRWLAFIALSYAVAFGAFVWLGLRESTVLGFTGISRVVLNASNAIVVLLPLVSLVATCQAVVRARSNGAFELFLSQPCRRNDWFLGMLASRLVVLVSPLALILALVLGAGAVSANTEAGLSALALRSLSLTSALVFAFTGLGLAISAFASTSEKAIVLALLVWLGASALHDFALIGLLLEQRLEPELVFLLAALNPVEACRLALFSGIDPELSVLGPVGFWVANTLGSDWTFAIGLLWPVLVGLAALVAAGNKLNQRDLIG